MWNRVQTAVMAETWGASPIEFLFPKGEPIMAVTSFATGDNLAVKLWSKKIAVEALKQTWC